MENGVGGLLIEKSADLLVTNDKDVEAVLSELNLKSDNLDEPEFDVIGYINEMFPNEQSLSNINDVIRATESQIMDLEAETKSIIRDCWQCESGGQDAVEDAMQTIKTLFARVHDVQDRATRSEEMVHDITKDIQLLDQAKRNLTVSITTLNNLILIVNALDRLGDLLLVAPSASEKKVKSSDGKDATNPFTEGSQDNPIIFRPLASAGQPHQLTVALLTELADLLPQVQHLMQPMQAAYGQVPAVRGLALELDAIQSVLADRLVGELKALLSATRLPSDGNSPVILAACRLVDLLPGHKSVRSEVLSWFITRQLAEYKESFDPSQTVAWLDKIDHRYAWLKSNLPLFERKYGGLFPEDWHVSEQMVVQFCRQTYLHLEVVMKRRRLELTHNLIIFGLQRTLVFEASLNKVYANFSPGDLQSLLPVPTANLANSSGGAEKSRNPFDSVGDDDGGAKNDEVAEKDLEERKEPNPADCDDKEWKKQPFDCIISSCFDAHFDIYLSYVEKALQDQLTNQLIKDTTVNKSSLSNQELSSVFQDDKTSHPSPRNSSSVGGSASTESGENTLSSATDLFCLYKQFIKQTLQLNRGQGLMGLVHLLREFLSKYAVCVLLARIPGISGAPGGTASGSAAGNPSGSIDLAAKMAAFSFSGGFSAFGIGRGQSTATSAQSDTTKLLSKTGADSTTLAASQMFTSLLRDETSTLRLSTEDVYNVCVVLVTASFCYKTVEDLEKRLKSEVRPPSLSSQISFAAELEGFTACRSVCVHRLVSHLEAGAEPQLAAMARLPWNNLIQVGDQSIYVTGIINHLKAHIPVIRETLFNVRSTYTQICIKFAGALITRFITALYRCKPLNMFGAEQLLLDTQSLKSALNQMPTFGAKFPQTLPRSFTNLVQEEMGRAERIIKSVMLPVGQGTLSPTSSTVGDSSATGMGPVDARSVDTFLASFRQLLPDATASDLQKVLDMKGVKPAEQQSMLEAYRVSTDPLRRTASQALGGGAIAGHGDNRRAQDRAIVAARKAAPRTEPPVGNPEIASDQTSIQQQAVASAAGLQSMQQPSNRMRPFEKLVKMRRS